MLYASLALYSCAFTIPHTHTHTKPARSPLAADEDNGIARGAASTPPPTKKPTGKEGREAVVVCLGGGGAGLEVRCVGLEG